MGTLQDAEALTGSSPAGVELAWTYEPMLTSLMLSILVAFAPAADEGVRAVLVEDSLSQPLYVTAPPGDNRLFVVEKTGAVKVLINDVVVATYLDVGHLLPSPLGSEQGLLGLAFHPDFMTNGRLYLAYTDSGGDLVVAELTVDATANSVSLSSLDRVIEIAQPFTNHNGGMVLFGPDGYLYLGSGDGGGSGDPQGNGQNKDTLLGAILRIDVDLDDFPGDPLRDYGIPVDNPFVGVSGADEVFIYGLRNPWRFWIDPPTGRWYVADVGQNAREEVTILEPAQAPGANLGWNRLEGSRCFPSGGSCSTTGTVLPQVEYSHGSSGASVTGGVVYRGSRIPELQGTYFYADFIAGWVKSFRYDGAVRDHVSRAFGTSLVSSFGLDGRGNMYIVSLGGSVWRVEGPDNDEVLFYRADGTFRYYDVAPDASLGAPLRSGSGYAPDWRAITGIDLDGDLGDEILFYKAGIFAYYDVRPDASIGAPIRAGDGYSHKWDSVTNVDLDGDGQDEIFFYDAELGLFAFYDIAPDARIGAPTYSGTGYSAGWDTITAVDLDGDGFDEMLFYRSDGTFKLYRMQPGGRFDSLISSGTGFSKGWSSVTAVDLDGDGDDELLFYRNDGTFKYYRTSEIGLGSLIRSGSGYSADWTSISGVDLD